MKTAFLGASLAAIVGSVATADVTYSFTNQTWTGFNFTEAYVAGSLSGTLTGLTVNATLNASVAFTYANDLCVYVAGSPLAGGGLMQCGGSSDLKATERYFWGNGDEDAPGTLLFGGRNFTTGLNMTGSTNSVWIGNGYVAAGTSGNWTGSITLLGVNAVPAPGAIALVGLAGLVGRRRRS